MYNNIGEKIKKLAQLGFVCGVIISVIMTLIFLFNENPLFLVFLIPVPLMSLFLSWPIYGFGELIEKASSIEALLHTQKNEGLVENNSNINNN